MGTIFQTSELKDSHILESNLANLAIFIELITSTSFSLLMNILNMLNVVKYHILYNKNNCNNPYDFIII